MYTNAFCLIAIKIEDIMRAKDIFGPNLEYLKDKTAHSTQEHVTVHVYSVPQEIFEKHRNVMLCLDVMFINKIPFVIPTFRSQTVKSTKKGTMVTSIAKVIKPTAIEGSKHKQY